GGDTIQMERTAQFLRGLGHRVDFSFELAPMLRGYDAVHLFNLTRAPETVEQARNAARQARPYVLSSVYWDLESAVPASAYEFPRNWWRRVVPVKIRSALRHARGGGDGQLQAEIAGGAAFILPNSDAEKQHLLQRFPALSPEKLIVVLNGVDPPPDSTAVTPFSESAGAFVCAGGFGPRKNQLNLVRAFQQLPEHRLVIVGEPSPGSGRYLRGTKKASLQSRNVTFRGHLPHEYMPGVIRQALAIVQPSYIETPGLTAMEAASMGVPIVVADVAPVREYFGDVAHYCDPASPDSIAAACRAAAAAARPDGAEFARMYAWQRVLKPLEEVYERMSLEETH
ncbi:MAG TPA: glycosyltransferase, partial [Phycisphaerae bacterium]|nr:glycosyltransferase [Phycisphaerae bacterium]